MGHVITLIPGDGIGPEVTEAVVRIFKAAGLVIEWERHDAGVMAFKRFGQTLPAELLESITRNRVALKGPVTTPIGRGIHQRERRASEGTRSLRQPTAGRNLPGVRAASPASI